MKRNVGSWRAENKIIYEETERNRTMEKQKETIRRAGDICLLLIPPVTTIEP